MASNKRGTSKSDQIDKQKQRRYDNQISEFEDLIAKVRKGDADPIAIDDQMETALSNIDETVTTLQTRMGAIKEKKQSKRKSIGKKHIKSTKEEGLFPNDVHKKEVSHREVLAEIKDWRGYQLEIADLSRQMLRFELKKRLEDEIDVEAAKRYVEVVEDKLDNIKDLVDSRVDDQKEMVENRIDAKVGQNQAEMESRVTSVEKDVQHLQKNVLTVFETVMASMEHMASAIEDNNVENKIRNNQEDLQEISNTVDPDTKAKQVRENVESEGGDLQPDSGTGQKQKIKRKRQHKDPADEGYPVSEENSNESLEGKEVGTGEDDEEEEDSGPEYKLKYRAMSEMKEEFERMYEELDEDELSYRKVAEKSDVSKESVKNKIESVREDNPEEDICPPLGNKKN